MAYLSGTIIFGDLDLKNNNIKQVAKINNTTALELSRLEGVTSNIQTQFTNKVNNVDAIYVGVSEPVNKPVGLLWFNSTSTELKFRISTGWVTLYTGSITQYESMYTVATNGTSTVPINITGYIDGQVLLVDEDGVLLVKGQQYNISADSKNITLIGYTLNIGKKIHFTNIR